MLTQLEIANWTALYAATALCCALAIALTVPITLHQVVKGEDAIRLRTTKDVLLALPRIYWRWNKNYFFATPAILAIVTGFGLTLPW
jgi:hypothetical protein